MLNSSSVTSFELQTFRNGDWKIDSIYDDKELAIDMAKRLVNSRRTTAARVVEETMSDLGIRARVVYRKSLVDGENIVARTRKTRLLVKEQELERRRQEVWVRKRQQQAVKKKSRASMSLTWLFLKVFAIGIVGFLAMTILGHFIMAGL